MSTRREPGVLSYERFVSDDGKVVQAYERYADSAAAAAHLQAFQETFSRRFVGMVDRRRLTAFGAPTDELRRYWTDWARRTCGLLVTSHTGRSVD